VTVEAKMADHKEFHLWPRQLKCCPGIHQSGFNESPFLHLVHLVSSCLLKSPSNDWYKYTYICIMRDRINKIIAV